jgi:hypothetical protein
VRFVPVVVDAAREVVLRFVSRSRENKPRTRVPSGLRGKEKRHMPSSNKPSRTRALKASDAAALSTPILTGHAGDTLTVTVDVENLAVPFTVVYDKRTLMYSLVDRQEEVTLVTGMHRLSWAFTHVQKGWKYTISAKVSGAAPVVLDQGSEAHKDSPYAIGLALIEVV